VEHRSYAPASTSLEVRNASSERTLHVQLPGVPNALVKLDLAHVMNSLVYRPLAATAGEASIALTEFLVRWVDEQNKPNDAFAFLPEPMTVADTKNDVSAIVRMADPYPPPANGKKTWIVPMYSLTAPDPDFADQPPMLMRLVNSRPDQTVPPLKYALDSVVDPMIESALRVYLDLGSSAQAHGQNTFLEIGEDGRPSGRIVHADLEAFWPNPDLAKPLGRADFFSKYDFTFNPAAKESSIGGTWSSYFVSQNLGPIVDCLAKELNLPRAEVSNAVQQRIKAGVEKRRDAVMNNPALAEFRGYLS
jgi:siderophore synthetase component